MINLIRKCPLMLRSCILVSLSHFASAQNAQNTHPVDSAKQKEEKIGFGFGWLNRELAVAPTVYHSEFNRGNIHDAYQLIQGKLSGVIIARPGNDPNEPFNVRIRGMNSIYLSNSPLVVVDGAPYSSLIGVDPLDIESITVVKDAATASQFGLNSQSGVILIQTHHGSHHGLNIRHYTAWEKPDTGSGMLNSAEYVNSGGVDLGHAINWKDEITRDAWTRVTHISYGDKKGSTEYYGSLGYRNARGVLERSGFNNLSGRLKVSHSFLNDRLLISGNASITGRNNSFSFPEAFKYAKTFNPTSDVTYADGTAYWEYQLFDNYNPAGIVRQNINDGKTHVKRWGANASMSIFDDLKLIGGYSGESRENQNRRYWSQSSDWLGELNDGYRQEKAQALNSNFVFASVIFSKRSGSSTFDATGNISFQNLDFNESLLTARGFQSDEEGSERITDLDAYDRGVYHSLDNSKKNHGITTYRGSMSWSKANRFFLHLNVARERYSDNIEGTTFGAVAGFDFAAGNDNVFSRLKPKVSWGKSAGALAFTQSYNPGNIILSWSSLSNNKISPERKAELGAGIDWALKNISGSINFFSANSTDIVAEKVDYDPDTDTYSFSMSNQDAMSNSGIEIDLLWKIVDDRKLSVETALNFSTIRNRFKSVMQPRDFQPLEFILSHGSTNLYTLRNNKPVGQFIGFAAEGIVNNQWDFKDVDHSGNVDLNDMTTFGHPLPSSFLGWTSSLKMGRWTGSLLFRGAFGHYLFNSTRFGFENMFLLPLYNATRSVLSPPINDLNDVNYPSDFYLEKASYFTLDNIGISYDLVKRGDRKFSCSLNLAAQNVFIASSYSGRSPEVRSDYFGISYAAGYDSQYTYANSRTFLAGIHFRM